MKTRVIFILSLIAIGFAACQTQPQKGGNTDLFRHSIHGPVRVITKNYHGGESPQDTILGWEKRYYSPRGFMDSVAFYEGDGTRVRLVSFEYQGDGFEWGVSYDSVGEESGRSRIYYNESWDVTTEEVIAQDSTLSRTIQHRYGPHGLLAWTDLIDSLGHTIIITAYGHDSVGNRTSMREMSTDSSELSDYYMTYSKPDSMGNWTQKERRFTVNDFCVNFITRTIEYYENN